MRQKTLQELYAKFNQLYFGDVLPKQIKILITAGKTKYGMAYISYKYCRLTNKPKYHTAEYGIRFQKRMMVRGIAEKRITWESVLLHEMCHIYFYSKCPEKKIGHSEPFMAELKRIEAESNIPQNWDFKK